MYPSVKDWTSHFKGMQNRHLTPDDKGVWTVKTGERSLSATPPTPVNVISPTEMAVDQAKAKSPFPSRRKKRTSKKGGKKRKTAPKKKVKRPGKKKTASKKKKSIWSS
jgi:hypothetical protein